MLSTTILKFWIVYETPCIKIIYNNIKTYLYNFTVASLHVIKKVLNQDVFKNVMKDLILSGF